jgi:hypothetical protein
MEGAVRGPAEVRRVLPCQQATRAASVLRSGSTFFSTFFLSTCAPPPQRPSTRAGLPSTTPGEERPKKKKASENRPMEGEKTEGGNGWRKG